jgi:hypothetical protein
VFYFLKKTTIFITIYFGDMTSNYFLELIWAVFGLFNPMEVYKTVVNIISDVNPSPSVPKPYTYNKPGTYGISGKLDRNNGDDFER